jgi:MoxR-like ATPase
MQPYTKTELKSMAHGRVKKLAIAKAKQLGRSRSWIQTTPKDKLIEFIMTGGSIPPLGEGKTKNPVPKPAPTPTPTPTPSQGGTLEDMMANMVLDKIKPVINDGISNAIEGTEQGLVETFNTKTDELKKKVDEKINHLQRPIKVFINDVEVKDVGGIKHKQFDFVLECLKLFKRVWLCGPSGTGKSYLIEQCAKALGFDAQSGTYEYLKGSAGVTESHMTGRMTFDGTFIDGAVARSFRNGTFLCLDEFDGFDANCGLVFNSVFDNQGILSTPNDKNNPFVLKNENFHVAVASNTWGDGNDFEFAGRGQLDLATLDRLQAVKVHVEYDKNIERALAGEFTDMATMLWSLRDRCEQEHVRRTISTRLFLDGQKWMLAKKSNAQFLDIITTGWTKEEKSKVNVSQLKREYK